MDTPAMEAVGSAHSPVSASLMVGHGGVPPSVKPSSTSRWSTTGATRRSGPHGGGYRLPNSHPPQFEAPSAALTLIEGLTSP